MQIYAHIFISFQKLKPQTSYKLFRSQSFEENRKRDIFRLFSTQSLCYLPQKSRW